MSTQIASLFARISADTSGFEGGMRKVDGMLGSVGHSLTRFATMGVAAATGAVAGLGFAFGKMVMTAAEMEQQLANITAVMGLTTDQTAELKVLIEDLGIDPTLKVSATEAAAAIEMLGKNGLTVDQILNGAAKATVLLANSTGGDFALAADVATSAMLSFGLEAQQMNGIVSSISGSLVQSKFGINDYALALSQGGGVASAVGVSFEDFNATIAAISPLFGSGSDAGTSFKTFLQRLVPASADAEGAMRNLGLITEDGRNRFFTATGEMESMSTVAGLLSGALGGLSDAERNQALSTIFGTDAMRAAAALAMVGEEKFTSLKVAIGDTDAEQQAAVRMDTLAGKIEILRGVLEAISIRIGDKFIPAVKQVADWALKLVTDHQGDIDEFFGNLANWVTKTVDNFIKNWPVISKAVVMAWEMIKGALPQIQTMFGKLSGWFTSTEGKRPMEWLARFIASGVVTFRAIGDLVTGTIEGFQLLGEAVKAAMRLDFDQMRDYGNRARSRFSTAGMTNPEMDQAVEDILTRLYGGRALGGYASGMTLVGERGPELVDLPNHSMVHNARDTAGMMGRGTTINIQAVNLMGSGNSGRDLREAVSFLSMLYA